MANERKAEKIVRDQLVKQGYVARDSRSGTGFDNTFEEQSSDRLAVSRLLKKASKTGGTGVGFPEFVVHLANDILLVVECKAKTSDHGSTSLEDDHDQAARYAIDGVLHYARFLSKDFHVIAMAVSGSDPDDHLTTMCLHRKGESSPTLLLDAGKQEVHDLRPASRLIEIVRYDPEVAKIREETLKRTASELHKYLRNYAALSESEKPLIIAGSLIALSDPTFAQTYQITDGSPDSKKIMDEWVGAIRVQFQAAQIPMNKADMVVQAFRSTVEGNTELLKRGVKDKKGKIHTGSVLRAILDELNENVAPAIDLQQGFDLVGHFYGEFLRYTAGDKKGLGIVLTPPHITDLFCRLAGLTKDSTVLDPCTGTGGFLVAAMSYMSQPVGGVALSDAQKSRIKREGLVGVEKMPNMFALACANMILRGDGKANMYQGSCFDQEIIDAIAATPGRPDAGLANPPYSMGKIDKDLEEMSFILTMLDQLERGGTGVVIVPMSCAIGQVEWRKKILARHTLEAAMTMPSDLFYGVGTQTVTMVFTAGRPHSASKRSWFAQWTDDGHITNRGRKERRPGAWAVVRDVWMDDFEHRRADTPGYCVSRHVEAGDEWLAAAYMETDYSQITPETFGAVLRDFAIYKLINGIEAVSSDD